MEVYLSQYSPLEREILRKPGNFSSGAHETSLFFCLKENIERKPKEQPPGTDMDLIVPSFQPGAL